LRMWAPVSPEAKDLVKKMMVVDIKARLTPAQVSVSPPCGVQGVWRRA
jgi:hypothetical protein